MTFDHLPTVTDGILSAFGERTPLAALSCGAYESMRYPRFPAFMRFHTRRFAAEAFGNVFAMDTRAMGGVMQLSTVVFTPNRGTDVPLLLIDVMAMGKKRAAFVEYYDLTNSGVDAARMETVAARNARVPDYAEKPAWYVGQRAPYSLIKGGCDDAPLLAMLADSVAAYGETCAEWKAVRKENLEGLSRFIDRMVSEGNPSSATMARVLGKSGAEAFFRAAIMPSAFTKAALPDKRSL